jgi:hypothetical protein
VSEWDVRIECKFVGDEVPPIVQLMVIKVIVFLIGQPAAHSRGVQRHVRAARTQYIAIE